MSSRLKVNYCESRIEYFERIDQLRLKLNQQLAGKDSLLDQVNQLIAFLNELNLWARDYDYKGIEANGFRCILEASIQLLKFGSDRYDNNQPFREFNRKFEKVITMMFRAMTSVVTMRDKTKESKQLFVKSPDLMIDYAMALFEEPDAHLICGEFTGFELPAIQRSVIKLIGCYLGAHVADTWKESLECFYNEDLRGRLTMKFANTMDINAAKRLILMGELWWVRRYLPFTFYFVWPNIQRTCYAPRQYKFLIKCDVMSQAVWLDDNSSIKDVNDPLDKKAVRYRFLRQQSSSGVPEKNGNLIVHVHGGGFVAGSPDSHEVYTRGWANHLAGTSIISIDYSVTPESRFPRPLQEILDVYLWATSGDPSVKKRLGFTPKHVSLVGDSCGATLVATLLLVLNDLRKKGHKVLMPKHLVGFYPVFTVNFDLTPSYFTAIFHAFLMPQVIMCLLNSYVPQTPEETEAVDDCSNAPWWRRLKAKASGLAKRFCWFFLFADPTNRPWYVQGRERAIAKLGSCEKLINHPYLSPINYDDMDSLSDVQLTLIALNMDPTLDHSIAMAKKWPGTVDLDVVAMPHGFLNFVSFGFQFNDAYYYAIDKMKNVMNYKNDEL